MKKMNKHFINKNNIKQFNKNKDEYETSKFNYSLKKLN